MATYVDDLLVWSKDPMAVIKILEEDYILKGVGVPEYYLGGNMEYLNEHWVQEGINMGFSAQTYIQNMIPKFEKLFGGELRSFKTPCQKIIIKKLMTLHSCEACAAGIIRFTHVESTKNYAEIWTKPLGNENFII